MCIKMRNIYISDMNECYSYMIKIKPEINQDQRKNGQLAQISVYNFLNLNCVVDKQLIIEYRLINGNVFQFQINEIEPCKYIERHFLLKIPTLQINSENVYLNFYHNKIYVNLMTNNYLRIVNIYYDDNYKLHDCFNMFYNHNEIYQILNRYVKNLIPLKLLLNL